MVSPILLAPIPAAAPDTGDWATIVTAVGNTARDAKADGVLIGWWPDRGHPVEIGVTGALADFPAEARGALLADLREAERAFFRQVARWHSLAGVPGGAIGHNIATADGILQIVVATVNGGGAPRIAARMNRLVPLIAELIRHRDDARASTGRAELLEAAIDTLDVGVLLLDAAGMPRFCNASAERIMARRDGLMVGDRGLTTGNLADTMRLQAAISHILAGEGDGSAVVPVTRRGHDRPLFVAIGRAGGEAGGPAAILHVLDPDQELQPLLDPVCRLYGLSPVESRLACLLADGATVVGAAGTLRVREQTARSYLKQIFLKTATSRQAELVLLLLKSCARTLSRRPRNERLPFGGSGLTYPRSTAGGG